MGTGLSPHFFIVDLKSHWFTTCTDLINFGGLIFHFIGEIFQAYHPSYGSFGFKVYIMYIILYLCIYRYIFTVYTHMLPYLLYFYCTSRLHVRCCWHATRCSVSSPEVRTERRLLCVTSGTPKPGLYGVF